MGIYNSPIMENQMENKIENEMETGVYRGCLLFYQLGILEEGETASQCSCEVGALSKWFQAKLCLNPRDTEAPRI